MNHRLINEITVIDPDEKKADYGIDRKMIALINPKLGRQHAEFLSLGCLAAVCRENGYKVQIIDASCQDLSIEDIISILKEIDSILVGVTITEFSIDDAGILLNKIRSALPLAHITVGGYYPSFNIDYMFNNYPMVDSVQYGEGERTFVELADAVFQKKSWKDIKGIAYLDETKKIKINPPQKLIENLDELPFPARDTLKFLNKSARNIPHMYTSRGCQGRCTFCSIHQFYGLSEGTRNWRARSAEKVVEELILLQEKYNCKEVVFFDDNFIGPGDVGINRARQIGEEIINRKLKVEFSISTRLDNIDYETFNILKKSGLKHVFVGVEAAVQRILDLYGKKMKVEDITKGLSILRDLNLSTEIGFIMFNPFITFREIIQNYEFLNRIRKGLMITTLNLELKVYRGQAMEQMFRKKDLITEYKDHFYRYRFEDPMVEQVYKLTKEKILWFLPCYNRIKDLKRYTLINNDELRIKINSLYDRVQDFDFDHFKHVCNFVERKDFKVFDEYQESCKALFYDLFNEVIKVEEEVQRQAQFSNKAPR